MTVEETEELGKEKPEFSQENYHSGVIKRNILWIVFLSMDTIYLLLVDDLPHRLEY